MNGVRVFLIVFLALGLSGCAFRDADTVDISGESELVPVEIEVKGIEDLAFRLVPGFSGDWYSDIYLEPLVLRLPDEKMAKISDKDLADLQKRFNEAKEKVFEAGELSEVPGPETLVIKTYMTDGTPSNAPLNWVATVLIGSVDVGNAALYGEGFIGARRVGAASGAYDGKIILEGYTKWGVVEKALEKWLTGTRQFFLTEIPDQPY
jgi:hypothetical protein